MRNKEKWKQLTALLLSVAMLIPAQAVYAVEGNDAEAGMEIHTESRAADGFVIEDGRLIRYTGDDTEVVIPNGVTSIGGAAFSECSSVTSIKIPSSVTSIGYAAFGSCSSLTSIEIPSSVTSIGDYAFADCSSLTSIEIPSSMTSIGTGVFSYCSSLTSIEIPSSITSIGYQAFSGCSSLTSIEIPSSVTSIWTNAFIRCSSLTKITVDGDNPTYDSREDCNAIIETTSNTLISGCKNTIIPSSVTSIGGAFVGCSGLASIEIPSNVTRIGNGVFTDCSSLTSITVDGDNPTYDSRENCNAIIETASNTLISGCKNTIIPSSVTSIGINAFGSCSSLTSIEIPGSVTSIGVAAFTDCSGLASISIPSSVTSIGDYAFSGCSKELVIKGTEGSYAQTYASKYGISFQATGSAAKKSNKVIVSKTSYSLTASAKQQTIASLGAKATGGTITYASNNKNVTVTNQGKVTIAKNFSGTAKITVTAQGSGYETAMATVKIQVAKVSQSFKNAVTKKTVRRAKKAQSFQIGAKATGKVTYTVTKKDAKKVLTVSKTGKVTIKKNARAGTYTVKVKATAAAKGICKKTSKTYTIKVTVKKK